jgi:hypothetical protein
MAEPHETQVEHVDLPDVPEIFADSVTYAYFDEGTFHIELAVTRPVHASGKEPVRKRYTACRLAVSAAGTVELTKRLNHLLSTLEKQGVFKRRHTPSPQVQ